MFAPKILVVDDSRTIRNVLTRQLGEINATVALAEDGIEGFASAKAQEFDLIVTDIDMPRMNGFDLCEQLKSCAETRAIPVIILSSNEEEAMIERGFAAGVEAYVVKNNTSKDLIPKIKEVLSRSALLRNRLVLVVDDSSFIRKTVSNGLSNAGFKVLTASNGQEALEILSAHRPDLILSDVNMPVMDGVAFCEAVRARPDLANVPFVVMSTETDRRLMREMILRGASSFMVKPFHVEQLVITAEKLLSDHFQLLIQERKRLDYERNMLLASISSLIQALEARDPYTRGHSESVSRLSRAMAKQIRLPEKDIDTITLAAKLHDIGKIGIPDAVLLKPGKLSSEEYLRIKEHPIKGAEILNPIPSLADLIPAVLQHHEKMDGSGYPLGLEGDSIHLWARIIAVADVYDALISTRPYRAAMPQDRVIKIIEDSRGNHLCPECVAAFLEVMACREPGTPDWSVPHTA